MDGAHDAFEYANGMRNWKLILISAKQHHAKRKGRRPMRAKHDIILIALLLAAASVHGAEKPKFVVSKNLIGTSLGGDVCNDVARMLRDSNYASENTCHWRFEPNGPNAQSPRWMPVDIDRHPEWVRDIAMMYTEDGLNLSPKEVDSRWNGASAARASGASQDLKRLGVKKSNARLIYERKRNAMADLRSGKYRYEEAWFDIDEDGKPDHVLARSEVECDVSRDFETPGGRVLFVIEPNGRVNMRSRGSRSYNPFFYGGRTYLLERSARRTAPPGRSRRTDRKNQGADTTSDSNNDVVLVGLGGSPRSNWRALGHRGEFSFSPICVINHRK